MVQSLNHTERREIMKDRVHHGARAGGRAYFGLATAGVALFWLASKAGWLGAGSSGVFWPVLALGLGLAMALGGSRHRQQALRSSPHAGAGGR